MAERKVNIFKVLGGIDRGSMDSYRSAYTDEERKEVDGLLAYPALRWMSAAFDDAQHTNSLEMVNEIANSGYFELGRHKELQFKLLCVAGLRQFVKHAWIAAPPTRRVGKILEMLRRAYPLIKDDEAELWLDLNGPTGVMELASMMGFDKEQRKALEEECKKLDRGT